MRAHKPAIGLTTYGTIERPDYRVPEEYVHAVVRAGAVPFLLPSVTVDFSEQWLGHLDGLVLVGGGDLDPNHYQGATHATVYNVDAARDGAELRLTRWVLEREFPTLAICRGMQLVNTVLGGTLHVHVPDVFGESVLHRAPPRVPIPHEVIVNQYSRLAEVMGRRRTSVASWHHQAIDRLGAGLRAVAWAEDSVIEAVEMIDNPRLIAVQWHPELTAEDDPAQQALFDGLVEMASETGQWSSVRCRGGTR